MGKARLRVIAAKFPDSVRVQADNHDAMFEYERAQRIVVKSRSYQTRALKHVRKAMKRFKKEMTAAQNKYERVHGKVMLFGFWKYWLASGKIGPEEDDEAQLVHA